jgi:YVTN family beta-propeller protein
MPNPSCHSVSRRSLLGAAFLGAGAAAGCRSKAKPFPGFAVVVTGDSTHLSAVDLAAFTLEGKIAFDAPISQVLFHPESRTLYAVSGSTGSLFEYNWASRRHARTVRLGNRLLDARFDPMHPVIWVAVSEEPALVRVSRENLTETGRIALPAAPLSFDVANWETRLTASLDGGGLAVAQGPDSREAKRIRESEQFGLVRFRSDGRQFLAANHTAQSLSIIRAADALSIVDLELAIEATHFCFKPDGGQLFVTDGKSGGVTIVYPYTTEVDRAVLAGKSPGAMAACSNPPYLLVANRESSDVTILDLDSGKLVAVVPVGAAPAFLAVTPDNQYALALNHDSGDMAVIRLTAVKSQRNKTAPLFTMVPVGEAPKSLAVIPA